MKKLNCFLSLIFILLVVSLAWNIYKTPEPNLQLENELCDNLFKISTINPYAENNNDLEFLKNVLKDKKIVLLGEQTHYDGTTILAKTRLVKYLHDSLNFNVLLFESSLYDIWLMNDTASKINVPINPQMGLWWFWSDVEETDELWEYISVNPIVVNGFDVQIMLNNISDSLRMKLIEHHFDKNGLDFNEYSSFQKLKGKMYWCTYQYHKKFFTQSEKDSILIDMANMTAELEKCASDYKDSIYVRYLKGMKSWYECTWKYDIGEPLRFHIRDSLMAENFFWHLGNNPDRKVIVWASNMHVMNAEKDGGNQFMTFGKRIKERFTNDCYSICFSSYCELNDNGKPYKTGSNLALEHKLHRTGCRYGFIDFQSLDSISSLKQNIVLRINQKNDILGKWSEMTDGLFYIDTVKKVTPHNI